jgi:transposase-like protein
MSQHFLLTAAARTVSLKQILRMAEDEAWAMFCSIRWPETEGAPVCPHCGCPTCWSCPRPNGAPRFRCSACRRDFSPTSGTLFAFHKLEIRDYLAAVVIFCDEVKGKAALALSRDLDVQYKTAFVLAHKIREAMASEVKDLRLGGAGRHVEIDGCYVGGYVRPENRKVDRKDLRLAENRSGKRQVIVVIRERALSGTSLGGTLPTVFASEDAAASFIRARVDRASTVRNSAAVACQSSGQRSPPVRRRVSGACQDTRRSNRPCATITSTLSVFPDSISPPKFNPIEPPWYVTRMPGGVGGAAP